MEHMESALHMINDKICQCKETKIHYKSIFKRNTKIIADTHENMTKWISMLKLNMHHFEPFDDDTPQEGSAQKVYELPN